MQKEENERVLHSGGSGILLAPVQRRSTDGKQRAEPPAAISGLLCLARLVCGQKCVNTDFLRRFLHGIPVCRPKTRSLQGIKRGLTFV